jgi:hypothetical protein
MIFAHIHFFLQMAITALAMLHPTLLTLLTLLPLTLLPLTLLLLTLLLLTLFRLIQLLLIQLLLTLPVNLAVARSARGA